MNYIDLLLIAVILISAWSGFKQGFILSAIGLLSWLASLVIAFLLYKPIAALLHIAMPSAGFWLPPFSFMLSIVISKLIVDIVANLILRQIPANIHRNAINKTLGIVPGSITGLIWAVIVSAILLLVPFTNKLSKEAHNSTLANNIVKHAVGLDESLTPIFAEALNRTVSKTTAATGKEKFTKLPFRVKHAVVRKDLEAAMLLMVNKERKEYGLQPLKADPELAVVARKHSEDMFARSYFSHYTPEGADPFARMRKDHIIFLTAGENLALAQTLIVAHNGLMHSPGHRANILNPDFGRLGIGILDGGVYGLMITQNFRN